MKLHDTTYKTFHEKHIKVKNMKNPTILGSSKIGTRGQITIPKKAREKFNLKTGDVVIFIEENGKLVIKKEI
jgi:AbrB family looped-hinge helix DNA binding protein